MTHPTPDTARPTASPFKGKTGLQRLINAAGYSWAGLRAAYQHEHAFRQEVGLAIVLLPLSFWVGRTWVEITLLAGSVIMLMVVELLNSAIENVVDRVSDDWHELSKRAKDVASAAVLLATCLCAGIWLAALWHMMRP